MPEQKQTDLKIYAIYDKKSSKYDNPFFAYSDLFAKRRYMLMSDEKGPLQKWPEDFDLHLVGGFDPDSGEVIGEVKIILEGKKNENA